MRRDPLPPIVSLLGASGSGKTTLAAALVRRWSGAGLRVGYLKHASHGFHMDRPGKDTDRVAEAGARGVAVTGPGGLAYVERGEPADPTDLVARFFADRDAVVLEGFRTAGFPAVVVLAEAGAADDDPAAAVAEARGPLLAVVSPAARLAAARAATRAATKDAPVFEAGDVTGIAAHLESALRLRSVHARP